MVLIKRRSSGNRKIGKLVTSVSPYLYIIPSVLLVSIFLLYPVVFTIYISFTKWNIISAPAFVGLSQYVGLFRESALLNSFRNTLIWTGATLLIPIPLSLLLAVGMYRVAGREVFKVAFFLPRVMAPAAIAVIWKFIYSAPRGILNEVLGLFGAKFLMHSWLLEPPLNTFAMIGTATWASIGWMMVMFLIGLDTIPSEVLEAGKLDGASERQLLWHVKLPLLKPMTSVVVVMGVIASFTMFDLIWVMTGGGPFRSSETLAVTIYRGGFVLFKMGYSAAIAVVLSAIVLVFSMIYLRRIFRHSL